MNMLDMIRAELRAVLTERAQREAEGDAIVAGVEAEGRTALNPTETESLQQVRAAIAELDTRRADLVAREAEEVAAAERRAAAERLAAEIPTTPVVAERGAAPAPAGVGGGVVRAEARTYHPGNDPKGMRFLADVAARHLGDWEAGQRLARHNHEERVERRAAVEAAEQRAAGTAAFAGLVVPQYLTDLYAPAAAAGRRFANICRRHDLPATGMTVNISRVTTATSAAAQSSENSAVSETNIDDTLLTESIFTVAGQQTLSRQAVERGIGTEDVTIEDLIRRYHTNLDSKMLNDATTGLTNVAGTVAYTDASPTAAELYPKILSGQASMEAVMLDQAADPDRIYAVMHSRRWAWMQSQTTTSWPFIAQPGYPVQAGGRNDGSSYNSAVRGLLPNSTQVVVDNNIATNLGAGTNEDEIYVVNGDECHLWEDPTAPMLIRTEATNAASLGILFVIYGYAAYCLRRYTNGHQKVAGTGLVTPTF